MLLLTARCSLCDRPKFKQFMYELPQFKKAGKPHLLCEHCHTKFIRNGVTVLQKTRSF